MRTRTHNPRRSQQGFSLIELLTVLVILTLVMGAVFQQMIQVQQRYQAEQTKLDMFQESRDFIDQMIRDLHMAGYPNSHQYGNGVLAALPNNDVRNAVGLVQVTPTSIIFEGDVDGNGVVDSVRYTLISDPANPGSCPCSVQRSQVAKLNGNPLTGQGAAVNFNEVQNVVNSGGAMGIAGQTGGVANQVTYGQYAANPVFQAFRADGTPVGLPIDLNAPAPGIKVIKSIRITLNVLGAQPDLRTHMRPVTTLTSSVRIEN